MLGYFRSETTSMGIATAALDQPGDEGWAYGRTASFAALISINLAIINLLPFPALDGGRLLFLLIEKIKGSRINPKVANTVNAIGFYLLIILMLVITYHDVVKLF